LVPLFSLLESSMAENKETERSCFYVLYIPIYV